MATEIEVTELALAEELDDKADTIGIAIYDAELAVRELFGELNFLDVPDENAAKLDAYLKRLVQVRDLLALAVDLYPFSFGADRE